jgi:hypothetical protein
MGRAKLAALKGHRDQLTFHWLWPGLAQGA